MKSKIKDFLYRLLIAKDRQTLQEEMIKRGYEQGVADERDRVAHNRFNYNILSNEWFVEADEIFEVNSKGILFLGTDQMTDAEIKNLKEEIKFIEKSRIWFILQETLRQKAVEKSVLNSTEWEHVLAGKMMIHSLGVFKSILNIIKRHK